MPLKPTQGQIDAGEYRNHPRYSSCVAHWLCHEGGGLTLSDVSGYKNNGTFTNGATWTAGQFGPALSFDGTNDYVAISPTVTLTANVSYSFWVRPTGTQDWRCVLGGANDFGLFLNPTNFLFCFTGGITLIESTTACPQDAWTHWVLTYDGPSNVALLYLNARQDRTSTEITRFNVVTIGTDETSTFAECWQGAIDDIRAYTRVLSPAEILSLYYDPFLEFQQPVRRWFAQSVVAAVPARGFALLGVGR